jgi:glycosyltransferase involved in cell wall biosynthesis
LSFALYILFAATLIQLFYFFFFYIRILNVKESNRTAHEKSFAVLPSPPTVSVIVCAHNERENLQRLVPAILEQQYPYFELIVADDRSSDGTFDYFQENYADDSRFRMIRIEENSEGKSFKKYALTKAVEAANYTIVLLTDADCLPLSVNWIREMTASLGKEKKIVLGYSPYEYERGWLNLLIRYETLYTAIQYFSFALAGIPYMGVGRNLLYKKSVFEKNNGFSSHINIVGGDDDLFIREVAKNNNTGICIKREGQMLSIPKKDFFSWVRQKRRHLSVGMDYKWRHKFFLGLQTASHLFFYLSLVVVFFQDYKAAFFFLMIRSLAFVVIFALIARKLGDSYKWGRLLFVIDIVYIFNYLIITLSLVLYKKIKWS